MIGGISGEKDGCEGPKVSKLERKDFGLKVGRQKLIF